MQKIDFSDLLFLIRLAVSVEHLGDIIVNYVFQMSKTTEESLMVDEAVKNRLDFFKE